MELSSAVGSAAKLSAKVEKKYLQMFLWICLSTASLGIGTLASGLLSQEENSVRAVFLFVAALAGAASCIFFFFRFLREISPKPRGPFISTLQ